MRGLLTLRLISQNLSGLHAALSKMVLVSPEVSEALKTGKPVVALESTIITHGMDYPVNLQTALEVEHVIRENGAIPATIAIIKGVLRVGLTKEDIEFMSKLKREEVRKCSKR